MPQKTIMYLHMHSFNYYVPGMLLSAKDTTMIKKHKKFLPTWSLHFRAHTYTHRYGPMALT